MREDIDDWIPPPIIPPFSLRLDFDATGDPPEVTILDGDNAEVITIYEDVTCTASSWSHNPDDWQPGPFAQRVLRLLNQEDTNDH